jgi:dTDP-glucose pyrophosphorylase
MWGIIPAAGKGSRIQPLAFSKELLPVGARGEGSQRRPRAVSDYLIERLVTGGATRLCMVISPSKADIIAYYGGAAYSTPICYALQPEPRGLCDAIFRAAPFIEPQETVLVGLPDTIWFPVNGLHYLPEGRFSFLLFSVSHPQDFDAVVCDPDGRIREIYVKNPEPQTNWVWGAFKMPGHVFRSLYDLWQRRGDEYIGTLVNAWLAAGGEAWGVHAGISYLDVGAMDGYLEAVRCLTHPEAESGASRSALP